MQREEKLTPEIIRHRYQAKIEELERIIEFILSYQKGSDEIERFKGDLLSMFRLNLYARQEVSLLPDEDIEKFWDNCSEVVEYTADKAWDKFSQEILKRSVSNELARAKGEATRYY